MSIWGWLKLTIAVWLFRKLLKVTGWLIVAAMAIAAWPVTVVAVVGSVGGAERSTPPESKGNGAIAHTGCDC